MLNSCKRLEELGCEVTYLPVNGEGVVDPDERAAAIAPEDEAD